MDNLLENTSGQGKSASAPVEIKGWNWGAFFLPLIWGIGNKVWIGLLAIIPIFWPIMMIVLGAKGNKWAWKNKKWESVEHFKKTQKIWAIVGLIIFIIPILIIGRGLTTLIASFR